MNPCQAQGSLPHPPYQGVKQPHMDSLWRLPRILRTTEFEQMGITVHSWLKFLLVTPFPLTSFLFYIVLPFKVFCDTFVFASFSSSSASTCLFHSSLLFFLYFSYHLGCSSFFLAFPSCLFPQPPTAQLL